MHSILSLSSLFPLIELYYVLITFNNFTDNGQKNPFSVVIFVARPLHSRSNTISCARRGLRGICRTSPITGRRDFLRMLDVTDVTYGNN